MKYLKLIVILYFALLHANLWAQISNPKTKSIDSTDTRYIPLEEIPAKSLRALTKIDEFNESIISLEEVKLITNHSDSILGFVEAFLIKDERIDFDSLQSRKLVNKSRFWKRYKVLIANQIELTEDIIHELASKSKNVNKEKRLWLNTKLVLDSALKDPIYERSISEVIEKSEKVNNGILDRTKLCYASLKMLNESIIRIDKLLLEIRKINRVRQEEVFDKTHSSFGKIVFDKSSYRNPLTYSMSFYEDNLKIINRYFQDHKQKVILFTIYLLFLIVLFIYLMRRSKDIKIDSNNIYENTVVKVLQRPISLAIILSIFSSTLFYPERPPILIDLSILILVVPIINIVVHVSNKKSYLYLIMFTLLILLGFINYILPSGTPYYRFNLLLMGVLEIFFLVSIYRNINISSIINVGFNQFVRIIIVVLIIASSLGIIANFTGHLRIAKIAIDLPITNFLVGILLIISAVVFIGLIQLSINGNYLQKFNFINQRIHVIKKRVIFIVMLVAALLWINYNLKILRLNEIFYQFLDTVFNTSIPLGSASFTLAGILLFVVIIWLSVIVSDLIRAILDDDVLKRVSLKKGVPRMISVVVRFSLISIGVMIAVTAVGMPLTQLTIIISAFSVGIGFGLQNVVNNFVSGIILLFERPVQINDTVEVNSLIGTVKSMGIRSSNIRTFDGAEVIVPNANLISNEVINWTLSDKRRRIEIFSGVAYGSDVYKVKELLLNVLHKHPDILKEPEPMVLFNDLGESSLDFRLLFWTDNFDKWVIIKSEVVFGIHDALNNANIVIPFPQRDVYIKYIDKNQKE